MRLWAWEASVVVEGVFLSMVTIILVILYVDTSGGLIHGFGICIGNRITCSISTSSISDTGFRVGRVASYGMVTVPGRGRVNEMAKNNVCSRNDEVALATVPGRNCFFSS